MGVSRFLRIAIFAQLFLICALVALLLRNTTSATQNNWASGTLPNIDIGAEVSPQYPRPGNRDCFDRNLQTLVLTTPQIESQTEKSVKECAVSNQLGVFGSSYLNPHTYYSYKTTNSIGQLAEIVGVPNQPMFLHLEASGSFNGKRVHIFNDVRSNGTFELQNSNTYRGYIYKLNSSASEPLKDLSGTPLRIKEFAFSNSGEWMVAEVMDVGIARIHLPTRQMTLFSTETFRYGFGSAAAYTLAISNDGNTAIKSGKNAGFSRVYDISKCIHTNGFNVNNRSFYVAGCQERSLRDLLFSKINDGRPLSDFYLHSLRFDDSGRTIEGLLLREGTGIFKINKVVLSLDQIQAEPPISYVAMGDSFASGEGDRDDNWYEGGTNVKDVNMCHLSKRSYPYLLAADLGTDDFHSVACSGAQISHLNTVPLEDGAQHPTENPPYPYLPGYKSQKGYITNPPSFITLSIGGNDVGFGDILEECVVVPGTCRYAADSQSRSEAAQTIKNEFYNLVDTYLQLVDTTQKKTKIFVIGYPEFVQGEAGSCGLSVALNDEERYFAQEATRYMNDVIEAAAKAAGVYYVDAEKALQGRNLCSGASNDSMAVNGLTLGDDNTLPWYEMLDEYKIITDIGLGKESYHPNELGHKLLRDDILEKLSNPAEFQTCANSEIVICPDLSSVAPEPNHSYFGNLSTNSYEWRPERLVLGAVKVGALGIKTIINNLKPGSSVNAEIHSDPKNLGSFQADSDGKVTIQAEIPDSIEPGFHELHFYAENIAGEKIDYYQPVFITGEEGDINANNIPDSEESCGFVPESGVDEDRDNIDDRCDTTIAAVPAEESVPPDESSGEPKEPGIVLTLDPLPPEDDEEPDIIPGVNNTNTSSGVQQTSSSVQSTASQTQPASSSSGFQPTSAASPASSSNAANLLNQGVSTPSLGVVSAPYSTTPSAVATSSSPAFQATPENGGISGLAILIIGAFIIAFSVTTWNRYIKTPIPARGSKGKHR